MSLLFQKSLSRSLQRPQTGGERKKKKGKIQQRKKLNSCEKGRGKKIPAPPPLERRDPAERDGERGRPPRDTDTQTDGQTDGAGQSCGETGAGWGGEKDGGLERCWRAPCPEHTCPCVPGTRVRASWPPRQPGPGSAGCSVTRDAAVHCRPRTEPAPVPPLSLSPPALASPLSRCQEETCPRLVPGVARSSCAQAEGARGHPRCLHPNDTLAKRWHPRSRFTTALLQAGAISLLVVPALPKSPVGCQGVRGAELALGGAKRHPHTANPQLALRSVP